MCGCVSSQSQADTSSSTPIIISEYFYYTVHYLSLSPHMNLNPFMLLVFTRTAAKAINLVHSQLIVAIGGNVPHPR